MENIKLFIENIKERNLIDVLIAIGIVIVFYMVSSLFSRIVMKLFKIKGNDKEKIKNTDIYKSLKMIFLCAGFYIALLVLNLPTNWFDLCSKLIRVIFILNTLIYGYYIKSFFFTIYISISILYSRYI